MEKVFKFLIVAGIMAAIILSAQKFYIETQNNTVETVMDYDLFKEHDQAEDLSSWKDMGITSVAIRMLSLEDLEDKGDVISLDGSELQFHQYFTGEDLKADLPVHRDYIYFMITNEAKKSRIFERIEKGVEIDDEKFEAAGIYDDVIVISDDEIELKEAPLFFSKNEVELILENELNIVPRVSEESSMEQFLGSAAELPEFSKFIFSGQEIIGYPDNIHELAGYMIENKILYGFIEPFIAGQDGSSQLASLMNYDNIVRLHSVVENDMDFMEIDSAVDRYLRAVDERNVRSLYIKPYSDQDETEEFITTLSTSLEAEGYQLDSSSSFEYITGVTFYRYVIMVAFTALISLFVGKFNQKLRLPLFCAGILLLLTTYLMRINLIYALAALGIATFVPVWIFYYLMEKIQKPREFKDTFSLFGVSLLAAFIGGIAIQGVLFDNSYIVQANLFRGVKFSLFFPLLAAFIYLIYSRFRSIDKLMKRAIDLLNRPLLLKQVIIGVIVIGAGVFFLMRTGNEPLMAVSEFELTVRSYLEDIFQIRPRFKSFLFGYPALFFGLYLSFKDTKYSWILIIGLLGPINTINSFTHIHTPLLVSFFRELSGALLGLLIGLILVYIYKRWITYDKKDNLFRLLRLR